MFYYLPVPHNGYTVCNQRNLLHPVRNIDNPHILFLHHLNQFKKLLSLALSQSRGGFVKYNNGWIFLKCPCNGYHLLFRYTQLRNSPPQIHMEFKAVQYIQSLAICHPPIHKSQLFYRQMSGKNIFRY